jgi:cathepsin L
MGHGNLTGYIKSDGGNENDLAAKIQQWGVAAVSIDASHYSFQAYKSGIYDDPQCTTHNLDHAVGCVGWGAEGDKKFWIIRNSWGGRWGEHGYVRIHAWAGNRCGVATEGTIPLG